LQNFKIYLQNRSTTKQQKLKPHYSHFALRIFCSQFIYSIDNLKHSFQTPRSEKTATTVLSYNKQTSINAALHLH